MPPSGSDESPRASLLDLAPAELEALVLERGGRRFHADVIWRELFERGVREWSAMTSLPAALRAALAAELPILSGVELERRSAPDGTIKLLTGFARGAAAAATAQSVETVYIPSQRAGRGATLCVSTQIGCPVGCPFCASGLAGLARNLSSAEIVEQFLRGAALGPLSRAVVMGIGEPLLNYPALRSALGLVHERLGLGARRITVSTVGFPERLRRIAPERPPFQLAISLHTPFDRQRDELVPAMAGVPIEEVLAAGDDWFAQTGREVTYECVLLEGVNTSAEHAEALAERLRGRRASVNLIPFNPVDESPYARPDSASVARFQAALAERGLVATVRWSRGVAAHAACGQLRARAARARS